MKIHKSTYRIARTHYDKYQEGEEAHFKGQPVEANPYDEKKQPNYWIAWRSGWFCIL